MNRGFVWCVCLVPCLVGSWACSTDSDATASDDSSEDNSDSSEAGESESDDETTESDSDSDSETDGESPSSDDAGVMDSTDATDPSPTDSRDAGSPAATSPLDASNAPEASEPTLETIGSAGGVFESDDGLVSLFIPEGALAEEVDLSVASIEPAPQGALRAIELGPTGTTFAFPVTLTLSIAGLGLTEAQIDDATIALLVDDEWQVLPSVTVSASGDGLMASLEHFSTYGIVIGGEVPGVDPGGPAPGPPECVQNTCQDGCGCDPELAGASCQMGADGMAGCERCECDGEKFTCFSCEDVVPEPTPTNPGPVPDPGPGCVAVNSCDQRVLNSSCQEYDELTPAENVQSACVGGTAAAAACDRTDSLGGCLGDSGAGNCMVIWYYPPNFTTVEAVQQNCANNGRTYVAP